MIIRKELFKEGEQADGCCPVVITINHNGKSRRVGTSLYVKGVCMESNGCLNQ